MKASVLPGDQSVRTNAPSRSDRANERITDPSKDKGQSCISALTAWLQKSVCGVMGTAGRSSAVAAGSDRQDRVEYHDEDCTAVTACSIACINQRAVFCTACRRFLTACSLTDLTQLGRKRLDQAIDAEECARGHDECAMTS